MKTTMFCLIVLVAFSSIGYADRQLKEYDNDINYDEAKIPHYDLPPLMVTAEGTKIKTPHEWQTIRRPQILSLFSNLVYGRVPEPESPVKTEYSVVATDQQFMDGKATHKEVLIQFSNDHGRASITIHVVTPNNAAKPVPAVMKLGSGPLDELLNRGYAGVGISHDNFVGHNEVSFENSIHRLFFKKGQSFPKAREWGVLSAIAWGHSRVLDYLETNDDIDASRVAIMGHSKSGKAALWTAAQDERFALVISAQSGCAGAALWRRRSGETLQKMVTRFPYWLCRNAWKFVNQEDDLPVDKPPLARLDYHFDGRISRPVLENYLARSATVASLLHLTSDDDLRMMQNTGVKFAGRVIWMWGGESRIDALVKKGEPFVKRMHAMDPDIILQGAIFEIITTDVNNVPIPASVFEEFDLSPEARSFRYEDMIYPFGHRVDHWRKGASVPDMSRLETRMWFVYVGKRWIDMGLEAIHFGQVEIMDDRDKDHVHWRDMMGRLRSYARKHARRHMVLADAHVPSGGIVHNGELMFDLHSFPSRPKSVKGKPYQAILEKAFSDTIYGRSVGGRTPSGWSCEALPYIVEIDNFGSSDHPGQYRESDRFHVWGWDEIGWFTKQPEAYRNEWLEYAYRWVRETDPNGFFQLPLRRFEHYTASMTPPKGQRQEETIKAIWAASDQQ